MASHGCMNIQFDRSALTGVDKFNMIYIPTYVCFDIRYIEYGNREGAARHMDIASELIDFMLQKFRADKKWMIQTIDQISEEDIVWRPTPGSNSIANLISHIRGTVHQRLETIFYDVPDDRDRDAEFEPGLHISKEQAYTYAQESFDVILDVLERLEENPELWLSKPYLHKLPLTFSAVNNEASMVDLMVQMVREVNTHTGQILYIAKMRRGQLQWQY